MFTVLFLAVMSSFAPSDSVVAKGKHRPPQPSIVDSSSRRNDECKEDPLNPCIFEILVIKNPLLVPVEVTIGCGIDLDINTAIVPARSKMTVELEITSPVDRTGHCQIVGWEKVSP